MAYTVPIIHDYIAETCCVCSVRFCITKTLHNLRLDDENSFYCPNGHSQSYTKTEKNQLKQKLKNKTNESARYEKYWRDEQKCNRHLERSRKALRGQITRLKNV